MKVKNNFAVAVLFASCLLFGLVNTAFAQPTKESVTSAFNDAIGNANEDPAGTIAALKVVIGQSEQLGEEGAEIKALAESKLPALHYKVGNAFFKEKKYDDALTAFLEAKSAAEQYNDAEVSGLAGKVLPKVYYAIGSTHLKNKENDKALAAYDEAIALNPKYAKAFFGKSKVFRSKGDMDSVLEFTDKALELAGDKTKASIIKSISGYLYKKAKSNNEKSKFQDAVSLLEKAIVYDAAGDQGRYYYELGKAYQGLGQSSDACGAYRKATGKYAEGAKYQMEHKLKC